MRFVRAIAALVIICTGGKLGGFIGTLLAAIPAYIVCPKWQAIMREPIGPTEFMPDNKRTLWIVAGITAGLVLFVALMFWRMK